MSATVLLITGHKALCGYFPDSLILEISNTFYFPFAGGGNEHRQTWNLDRYHTEPQWQARLGHLGNFQSLQQITDAVFPPIG